MRGAAPVGEIPMAWGFCVASPASSEVHEGVWAAIR